MVMDLTWHKTLSKYDIYILYILHALRFNLVELEGWIYIVRMGTVRHYHVDVFVHILEIELFYSEVRSTTVCICTYVPYTRMFCIL